MVWRAAQYKRSMTGPRLFLGRRPAGLNIGAWALKHKAAWPPAGPDGPFSRPRILQ
jgi:hypothetical protein